MRSVAALQKRIRTGVLKPGRWCEKHGRSDATPLDCRGLPPGEPHRSRSLAFM